MLLVIIGQKPSKCWRWRWERKRTRRNNIWKWQSIDGNQDRVLHHFLLLLFLFTWWSNLGYKAHLVNTFHRPLLIILYFHLILSLLSSSSFSSSSSPFSFSQGFSLLSFFNWSAKLKRTWSNLVKIFLILLVIKTVLFNI